MKTAGVVIDFYDDPAGQILKKSFPTPDVLPQSVKEAHILSSEERDVLRNEAYALVLRDDGRTFRKFACVDEGNTRLSALYFEETADRLPTEAVKVAAANIFSFCQEFGIEPSPFIKMAAAGEGGEFHPSTPPMGAEGTGGHSLSDDKKVNGPSKKNPAKLDTKDQSPKTVINKKPAGEVYGAEITGENGQDTDWPGKKHANIVDVSGLSAPLYVQKTAAKNTALKGHYALDSYADVAEAVKYFDNNWLELTPEDRHEFAVKTASRAEELGIPGGEMLNRYGSTSYSPDIEAHLAARKANCDPEYHGMYDTLKEKKASLDPETFAGLLRMADKEAGLHWYYGSDSISDPYLATFGGMSEKQASAAWTWMGRVGDTINADQLKKLVTDGRGVLKKYFSHDIVNALQGDPFTVFDSLPDNSKVIICRLATEFDSMPTN